MNNSSRLINQCGGVHVMHRLSLLSSRLPSSCSTSVNGLQTTRWKVHLIGYKSVADIMGLSSFVQPLLPSKIAKSRDYGLFWTVHHHHHIYSPIITPHKRSQNSHTIGGLPEKPYSSLTGRPSKKNKLSTNNIIIQWTKYKQKTTTLCRCNWPWAIPPFIYNNHNSHNTIAR